MAAYDPESSIVVASVADIDGIVGVVKDDLPVAYSYDTDVTSRTLSSTDTQMQASSAISVASNEIVIVVIMVTYYGSNDDDDITIKSSYGSSWAGRTAIATVHDTTANPMSATNTHVGKFSASGSNYVYIGGSAKASNVGTVTVSTTSIQTYRFKYR